MAINQIVPVMVMYVTIVLKYAENIVLPDSTQDFQKFIGIRSGIYVCIRHLPNAR